MLIGWKDLIFIVFNIIKQIFLNNSYNLFYLD